LTGARKPDTARHYRGIVTGYFNTALPGNAFKWRHTEPRPGELDYAEADRCLAWCEQQGFATRGHCVFYSTDIHIQDWVLALDEHQLRRAMERRARGVARRYRGRVPDWDLSNEMLDDVDWFRMRLGDDIVREMAEWIKEEDPDAVIYFNEHDILTGGDVDEYVALIERMLELGVPLGGIGCQGHFDYPVDVSHVTPVLDRLAQFGLPIKITEFDIGIPLKQERLRGVPWIRGSEKYKDLAKYRQVLAAHGEAYEEEKAASLREAYRLMFAHPAVAGIVMWGFWEPYHWRGKGGIFRRDFTPYPAGQAYMDLVRDEWWTDTRLTADEHGHCACPAFFGTYEIAADDHTTTCEHTPGSPARASLLHA
jgi:GH35 family endo-1,4-beta-xylanase